jgi:hypothetical protein
MISLFGTLLKQITLLLTASLASWSASSLPVFPAWALIHVITISHFSLLRVAVCFLISSIRFFLFLGFLRDSKVILLSVCIFAVRGTVWLSVIVPSVFSALGIAFCSAWLFEQLSWRCVCVCVCMCVCVCVLFSEQSFRPNFRIMLLSIPVYA